MSIPRITQILEERGERDAATTAELLATQCSQEELTSLALLELKKLNLNFARVFERQLGDFKE